MSWDGREKNLKNWDANKKRPITRWRKYLRKDGEITAHDITPPMCDNCNGTGKDPRTGDDCQDCKGTGYLFQP